MFEESSASILDHYSGGSNLKIEIIRSLMVLSIAKFSFVIFGTRTATGREHFACQDRIVSQVFILIISNGETILSNVNVVV